MTVCFREAAKSLGYDRLKPEQDRVLSEFMSGKDVFVALPTGYGKSLCYAALPPAFDLKKFGSIELKQSIVIVVSPQTALIKDQVTSYSAKGLSVRFVTHESTSQKKESGKASISCCFSAPNLFPNASGSINCSWNPIAQTL